MRAHESRRHASRARLFAAVRTCVRSGAVRSGAVRWGAVRWGAVRWGAMVAAAIALVPGATYGNAPSRGAGVEVPAAANAPALQESIRYVRARADARVRNFPDANGNVITELGGGHLLRVYGTSQGIPRFHEVEVAGGLPVWVFGELLQRTDVEGVLRVNASQVNMRPAPESSASSMALRTKLQRGDKVLVIERRDSSKSLTNDWVKVWSPERARAWVRVDDTQPVADAAAARKEWSSSRRPLPTKSSGERNLGAVKNASAKRPSALAPAITVPQAAIESFANAEALFDRISAAPQPTAQEWADVVAAYEETIQLAPAGSATADTSNRRLTEARARFELSALRADLQVESVRRQEELERLAREQHSRDLERTAHWGRFQGRGWLESRLILGEPHHYIVFGGETTAEVRCSSGRYDLDVFAGFEIGVMGATVSPPVAGTELAEALPRILDVYRIEVISGSAARR